MGKLKQLHIDCTQGHCYARGYEQTCYMQEQDTQPTEPPEDTEGSDRDPSIDMDRN